jgi:hypothetical protein
MESRSASTCLTRGSGAGLTWNVSSSTEDTSVVMEVLRFFKVDTEKWELADMEEEDDDDDETGG